MWRMVIVLMLTLRPMKVIGEHMPPWLVTLRKRVILKGGDVDDHRVKKLLWFVGGEIVVAAAHRSCGAQVVTAVDRVLVLVLLGFGAIGL